MSTLQKMFIAVCIGILFPLQLFAQFDFNATTTSMYDDNVNNNALQLKSMISVFNFNGGYMWETEKSEAKILYNGAFNYYSSLTEKTNNFHSLQAEYSHVSGDEGGNVLNVGTSVTSGFNRDVYSQLDYTSYSSYIQYKVFTADWVINKFGYQFRYMKFNSLTDLNYTEHSFNTHLALALSQETTLIFQADLGTKYYLTQLDNESSKGKNEKSSLLPSIAQLTGMVKLGQKITDNSGLSITAKYQWNVIKQPRFLSADYGLISDDELFDDHYGYEGFQTSAMLTQIFTESITGRLVAGLMNKRYATLPAYDLEGNTIANERADIRSYISMQLQKHFEEIGISTKLAFDIIFNKSNDPLYTYHNNVFMLEVTVPF